MIRKIFLSLICIITMLFSSCDTLNHEEKTSADELNDISTAETRLEIEANLDDQKAYINKMSNFNPATIKTIDDRMAEIADRIPGFAGYYLEPQDPDLLNIEITDIETALQITKNMLPVVRMTNPERVSTTTHTELLQSLSEVYDMESVMRERTNFIIRSAKYNFRQLQDWRLSIKDYGGLTSVRIDEKENRVEVGVSDKRYVENVRSQLLNSGIPKDALSVIVKEPVKLNSNSLRSTYRPVIGGLEINRVISPYPNLVLGQCTLGFTARIDGDPYFVTNSHCSEDPFDTDSGTIYQTYPSQIGYEYYDPSTFNCPFGSKCRWSDASLYRLNSGVQYDNLIALPSSQGSISFNNTTTITQGGQAASGSAIFKVGITTGFQPGVVFDDCDSRKGNDGVWRMCSIVTSLFVLDGDSGSPVFVLTGNNPDAKLYGIIWGSNGPDTGLASHLGLITSELGSMTITF